MKLKDYKGYEIYVDEEGRFFAQKDRETVASAETLDALEALVDRHQKTKLGQSVIVAPGYHGGYKFGRITSMKEKTSYGGKRFTVFRVQFEGHQWEEHDENELYADTVENRAVIGKIASIDIEISRLNEEREKVRDQLKHFKLET